MSTFKVLLKSNHEDGDYLENELFVNYEFSDVPRDNNEIIDWSSLNAMLINEEFISLLKQCMIANNIDLPSPDSWTTEAYVIGVNEEQIDEDFDFMYIEDRIMTGDLI